jgi:glucose-6-phosphate 1-dehydrogenase
MVDKSTARMLVFGALGTLALVLIVAIYALSTKGTIQSKLEQKLHELDVKNREIKENVVSHARCCVGALVVC